MLTVDHSSTAPIIEAPPKLVEAVLGGQNIIVRSMTDEYAAVVGACLALCVQRAEDYPESTQAVTLVPTDEMATNTFNYIQEQAQIVRFNFKPI